MMVIVMVDGIRSVLLAGLASDEAQRFDGGMHAK
jgi:hypothetical protein